MTKTLIFGIPWLLLGCGDPKVDDTGSETTSSSTDVIPTGTTSTGTTSTSTTPTGTTTGTTTTTASTTPTTTTTTSPPTDACDAAEACWGDIEVEDEEDLADVQACSSIEGDLAVTEQSWLDTLALPCLTTVGGTLMILDNTGMDVMASMPHLTTVGGDMDIGNNPDLIVLGDLQSLSYVGGFLHVYGNDMLNSLEPLSTMSYIGDDLQIQDNPQLCQTDAEAFAAEVDVMGEVVVVDNGECD